MYICGVNEIKIEIMTTMSQHQIKCQVQNSKRMYFHYLKMSKKNDSKFVHQWVEDYKKEHSDYLAMVQDKEWVSKYGVLNYFQGKYTNEKR